MAGAYVVFKREFVSTIHSVMGYAVLAFFFTWTAWRATAGILDSGEASLRPLFAELPLAFFFFVPALCMRVWSEERKLGTIELLFTWPLSDGQILAGKFLAALAVVGVYLAAIVGALALFVAQLGTPDWGVVVASSVGALLLGATYVAAGCFASSLTENQVVAFVGALFFLAALWVPGLHAVRGSLPAALLPIAEAVSLSPHFDSIARGVLDSRDVVYYLSVTGVFLYLNKRVLDARRW